MNAGTQRRSERGGVGHPVDQPVDRLDPELVVGQLDDQAHHPTVVLGGAAGRGPLVAVGDGGLEPVMAVGQDERCRGDDPADLGDLVRHR